MVRSEEQGVGKIIVHCFPGALLRWGMLGAGVFTLFLSFIAA